VLATLMSKHQDNFVVNLSPAAALAACRSAVAICGWSITNQSEYGLVCQEPAIALSFKSPVTIELGVSAEQTGSTTVLLKGSNFGLGPIQSSHVKSQVQKLRQSILDAASNPSTSSVSGGSSGTSPSSSKRNVIVNGQRLSDEQIEMAARRGVQMADGNFWYDPMMGAWGYRGGPAVGIIQPGMDLGGPLPEDASNGNTGVFINGRDLPLQDVAILQRIVGMVLPGRYWLDANGNFGLQGGMMLGNIWMLARSTDIPHEGILSTYDKTGISVIGG
jgi:hypothetical protein